jgi:hypothetical protein
MSQAEKEAALRAEFAILDEERRERYRQSQNAPIEELTPCDLERATEDQREDYSLLRRLVDDGHALRRFYSRNGMQWTTPFHYICSFGKRRLIRRVLKKHADDPNLLRVQLSDDEGNAVEILLYYTPEYVVGQYEGDEERIHHKMSTTICFMLQSGKTTTAEVLQAIEEWCDTDYEDRVERVVRTWCTRIAAMWCCMAAEGRHAGFRDVAAPLGHILQRSWNF